MRINKFFLFKYFFKILNFLNIKVEKRIKLVQINLCIVTSNAPKEEIYLKIVPNKPHHKDPAVVNYSFKLRLFHKLI